MPVQLHVERLELRDLPATFGTPWPDGQHLTLSFAPDGTSILGTPSNLSAALAAPDSAARLAVLRAFQTWAVETNVNIGLVADSGAVFGTGGAEQHDPRFGDVRIGGRRLAPDVLAITAPYQQFDDYSGNVILNTAVDFEFGDYDLYTAALQEAGHALGVGNSPDTSSAMYEYYQSARTGLSATDSASIRALYGARRADRFEGAAGNDTIATAHPVLAGPITADLTTGTDIDTYRFTAGLLGTGATVNLRAAGLSLVTAQVDLLDSAGRVLATARATDPTRNDITLSLGSIPSGQPYFVRVSAARSDEFAIGSYELEVTPLSSSTPSARISPPGSSRAADSHAGTGYHIEAEFVPAPELASGSVSSTVSASTSFSLAQSGQVRLVLEATGASGSVEAVVTDANGHEVGRLATNAGGNVALDSFFSAGTYDVTARASGSTRLDFRIGILHVTDPIVVRPDDVSSAPAPTTPQPVAPPSQPSTTMPPTVLAAPSSTAPARPSTPLPTKPILVLPPTSEVQLPGPSGSVQTKPKIKPAATLEYVWWY